MFRWISSELLEFRSRLDLVRAEDMNDKLNTVLDHLVAVYELCKWFPSLLQPGVDHTSRSLEACAAVLKEKAGREEQCSELSKSLATVSSSLIDLQELFAVGAGLQSAISKATKYVSSGVFRVEFKPAAALVLEYGHGSNRTTLPEDRLGEQVCAAICVRSERMG